MCLCIAAGNFYIGFYIRGGKFKLEDGADKFMDIDKKRMLSVRQRPIAPKLG